MVLQLQVFVKNHEFWSALSSVCLGHLLAFIIQVWVGVACSTGKPSHMRKGDLHLHRAFREQSGVPFTCRAFL